MATLALAADASAATRYAAPDGTGPAASCPQANPCGLEDAVEAPATSDGDQVVVGGGVYTLSDGLVVDDAISVGGAPSAVPVILATTPAQAAVAMDVNGAELHDVTIFQVDGEPAIRLGRGTVDRVTAESDGTVACDLGVTGAGQSVIRDSVCWSGPAAVGASAVSISQSGAGTRSAFVRNVTAWAAGPGSVGLAASASGGGTATLNALNVIASGVADDVTASASASSTATLALTTSNFGGATTSGAGATTVTAPTANGNQIQEPQLAAPDAGSFDQMVGSPTIDAGSQGTLLGDRDLGGEPRIQGPEPDIGADERDGTPPRTTIDSGPAAAVKSGRVTFSFRSNEPGSTFACQVDDGPYERCSSPHTTSTLTQGDHVFRVRATDPAGNVELTPAERTFNVDKVIAGANVAARGIQRVDGKRFGLFVTVKADELARVRAAGTVKAGKHRYRVESNQVTLVAGMTRRLTLSPKSKRSGKKIAKALKRGKDVQAVLTATFVDLLGNRATSGELDVKVKGSRGKKGR